MSFENKENKQKEDGVGPFERNQWPKVPMTFLPDWFIGTRCWQNGHSIFVELWIHLAAVDSRLAEHAEEVLDPVGDERFCDCKICR